MQNNNSQLLDKRNKNKIQFKITTKKYTRQLKYLLVFRWQKKHMKRVNDSASVDYTNDIALAMFLSWSVINMNNTIKKFKI